MKDIRRVASWAVSPQGQKVIHRAVTGLLALIVALQQAHVL